MNSKAIPHNFEDFLYWVKETTERRWSNLSKSKNDGNWWNQKHDLFEGAKWIDPLTDEEIDALEIKWRITFPKDFRIFLKILHRVDRCDYYEHEDFETGKVVLKEDFLFHNWRDEELIKERFENLLEHLKFDVFSKIQPSWLKSWGPRPETEEECIAIMERWMEKARILIPVNSHRYLVSEPTQKCPHVISMYGFDTIVYSLNLREHLLTELRWDLGLDERELDQDQEVKTEEVITDRNTEIDTWLETRRKAYVPIPYWEEVILSTSTGWSGIGLKYP